MPRAAWSLVLLIVLALPLASCFNDDSCPTCPQENTGRISVFVRPLVLGTGVNDTLKLDSVLVSVDQRAVVKGLPNQTLQFDKLSRGRHFVEVERWYNHYSVKESKTSTILVDLDEGERRGVEVHGDFLRITWLPPGYIDRALARWTGILGDRVG